MRHVHHEDGAHFVRDAAQRRKVDDARVGAATADEQARPIAPRQVADLIVVDAARFLPHAIGGRLEQGAGEVDRGPVRQVPTVRQGETHELVAGFRDGEVRRHVRLRARVRLHVDVLGAEQLLGAIDRELLDLVDHLAPAVIPFAGHAFGVLVGQHRARRFEHRDRDEVLARDQLEPVLLPLLLTPHQSGDGGIGLGQRG